MSAHRKKEPRGCLFAFLKLFDFFSGSRKSEESLPYRLRAGFLSPAELSFFKVLQQAVPAEYQICPKVNLGDLFYVPRSKESLSYLNKINRKHVDFVLCDASVVKPVLAIELDDRSHKRQDRQERDQFVDAVFAAAGLPLLHITAARGYQIAELTEMIETQLGDREPEGPANSRPVVSRSGTPVCPQCETPMLLRKATRGARKGESFWGCANYPDCREIMAVE